MTILFLARLFYPHIGGVEKHVMEISKRLVARGHKVIVITEELPSVALPKKEKQNGIEIYRVPFVSQGRLKKFRIWLWLFKNRNLIKKSDVVHCHDVFFWYLPFRFLYPRKPVFTTFHGYESFPISKKAILIRKISEKLSFGNICIGDFIKKWYGTKPDYVSYGAVDIHRLSLRGEQRRSNLSKLSAIFIGRLDDQTGILTYNEAFKKLRKKYPKFEFLIVGDGPHKNLIHKQARVTGFQKDPEKYFEDHHFAFVTGYLSILEAMASKHLVFALYDNPLKKDYLQMTPFRDWIIIMSGIQPLIRKIDYYLSRPEKEKIMLENAYQWVKHENWEKLTKIYLTLWKKAGK